MAARSERDTNPSAFRTDSLVHCAPAQRVLLLGHCVTGRCSRFLRARGRSRQRISIAALTCYKSGARSWLIYRPRLDNSQDQAKGRKNLA